MGWMDNCQFYSNSEYVDYIEDKTALREEIIKLTEKFEQEGGEIEYLSPSHPKLTMVDEYLCH